MKSASDTVSTKQIPIMTIMTVIVVDLLAVVVVAVAVAMVVVAVAVQHSGPSSSMTTFL